jgi:hypothetical protein
MNQPPAAVRDEGISIGTIAFIVLFSLLMAGAIVWGTDSYFARMSAHTPLSTVGQGSSRTPAAEAAPAVIEGQAIKIEASAAEGTKTYTIEKKDSNPVDSRWPQTE